MRVSQKEKESKSLTEAAELADFLHMPLPGNIMEKGDHSVEDSPLVQQAGVLVSGVQ